MIEIERKFRLSPDQSTTIEGTLQEQYGPLEPVRQVDQVFLHGIDSFAEFERGMPVARLRTVNDQTELAFKRAINEAGDTIEHELGVSSADIMRSILEEMDFRPVTIVSKERIAATVGELAIVHDRVDGLGDFLEIEILADDTSGQAAAEQTILATAAQFGLSEADIEPRKYDELVSLPRLDQ